MPIFLVKEPARVDGNLFLILALMAPCAVLLEARNRSQFQMMLPRCSPDGALSLFLPLLAVHAPARPAFPGSSGSCRSGFGFR
jgi:hypothetical protein